MAKLEVSRSFVKEAHENACSTWKLRIEKEFPELFEKKEEFKIGDWVNWTGQNPSIGRIYAPCPVHSDSFMLDNFSGSGLYTSCSIKYLEKATKEEVEKHLIEEAKRRGYSETNIKCLTGIKNSFNTSYDWYYSILKDALYTMPRGNGGNTVYEKGKWAEIIQTMTKEEAEAKLNCIIV